MSIVTGVDIEVIDSGMIRVAGTGIYTDSEGSSIEPASNICNAVFASGRTLYVENPKDSEYCVSCPTRTTCRELLNLCTPIKVHGEIIGVINLICFHEEDKKRVMAQKLFFCAFAEEIAQAIGARVDEEIRTGKMRRMLDGILQATDSNALGILMLSASGKISYANAVAQQEFSLGEDWAATVVSLRDTGNVFADKQEYVVHINAAEHVVFGRFMTLEPHDAEFHSVLLVDPLPRLTEMLAPAGISSESPGGLDAIVGEGRLLARLKKRVRQIAHTSSTVLISGESGTGKEMFARAIHAESDRGDKPFVAINCGAIPEELLESELFGYVRGAFTGASHSGRMGKFELANHGVIFLDEIGSMSLYLQVKLLRVLQEKSFTRLGSNRPVKVDVRVIAATNEDLPALIEQRMFRDDLYYRLNVIPLELPPLRQRKEDIPRLAEYFLDRYCRRFNKPPARLSPRILEIFQNYSWPGNVREFENCIEYMINMHEGGVLSTSLVPLKIRTACSEAPAVAAPARVFPAAGVPPVVPLAELEAEAVRNAVAHFGDSVAGKQKAAEALGIGIATLYRKLQKNG